MSDEMTRQLLERIAKLEKEGVTPNYLIITPDEWRKLRVEAAPGGWAANPTRPDMGRMGTLFGVDLIVQDVDPLVELVKEHYGD